MRNCVRITILLVMITAVLPSRATAQEQGPGLGLKVGLTYPNFSSDSLDFDNRTGWHAGVFFGGDRSGVFGVQAELNWLRRRSQAASGGPDFRIDYLQIPVMLRLNIGTRSPNGFAVYSVLGPAFEIKIADEIEGFTLDDSFEGFDAGLVFGGGLEISRLIVEGRWEKGLRRVNKNFTDFTKITSNSFTVLVGVRFR